MRTKKLSCAFIFAVMATSFIAPPAVATINDMLDMSEKLDQLDKQDFQAAIDQANACTQRRDFSCANFQIGKAVKLASGSRDQGMLTSARQNMASERARIAEEKRLREEERLRVAEAEQAERRRQQEEAGRSSGFQWGKLAAIGVGAAIGGVGHLSSEVQTRVIAGAIKDSMAGQEGISNLKETTDNLLSKQKAQQAIAAQQERQQQAKAMSDEAANNERLLKAARKSRQPNGGQQQAVTPANPRNAPAERSLSIETQQASAQTAHIPSVQTYSGAPCGTGKFCTLGMSGQRWCDSSIPPNGRPCEEGCEIRGWGAAYHDTSLPDNVAYVPTGKPCELNCIVPNKCGG